MSIPSPDRESVASFLDCLFRHANRESFLNLRAFNDAKDNAPPLFIEGVRVGASDCIERICARIEEAARHVEPHVFCPPLCTFTEATGAKIDNLAEGVALSVECDANAKAAYKTLVALLGKPTVVVASGGTWINPETGQAEPKLHFHWRLAEPTRNVAEHDWLREARELAAELVGADKTAKAIVHPMRWPGSWHRKNPNAPRIARLKANPDSEINLGEALQRLRAACPPKARATGNGYDRDENGHDLHAELPELEAALDVVPNGNAHWEEWNRVGLATWAASSGRGFNAFDAWSRKSSKYDAEKTLRRWEHYASSPPSRIGAGSIFFLADAAAPGWRDKYRGKASGAKQGEKASALDPPEQQSRTWRDGLITAAELQTKQFKPIRIILPDLIPEGVTLLAGKPKIGKSWLALDVCLAVADENRFVLGDKRPVHGNVLYLALEDSPRRLKRRIDKIVQAGSWPTALELHTEWKRMDHGGLVDIESWITSVETPRLIWVDTLAKLRALARPGEPPYAADYRAIEGVQKLAGKYGVGVVFNHHLRKMASDDDAFDEVSGTLGLTGAADTIIVMKRHSGMMKIYVRGRDLEEAEFAAEFNRNTCRWRIVGEAEDVFRSQERQAIIAVLKDAGTGKDGQPVPMSVAEILAATERTDRQAIYALLHKMQRAGDLVVAP
jgi:hypothetical protein